MESNKGVNYSSDLLSINKGFIYLFIVLKFRLNAFKLLAQS